MIERLTCEKCGATIIPATLQAQRDDALAKCDAQAAVIERIRGLKRVTLNVDCAFGESVSEEPDGQFVLYSSLAEAIGFE